MTVNNDPSTFLDKEKEVLWYLGGQRIINALGEGIEGAFRLTEFVTPAGTSIYAHRHKKEDEAHYVIEGEATISCGGQVFHVSAGAFVFLPCNVPHHMEVSTSGPFRYLTWMTPAGFAYDVTKMGNPNTALLLAPPLAPDRVKVQQLADLLRESTALTSLEDLHFSYRRGITAFRRALATLSDTLPEGWPLSMNGTKNNAKKLEQRRERLPEDMVD